MHVVATAGHVDHGKSTLVEALTGQQPDRLEEERRRGLSIRLGYCWTTLPRAGEVAFVDVPGHERFLATALSGLGPVPAVVLVVAADDPWMPQTAEHLAALDALGVRHGVLVVSRCDLADPGPALARARAELARTSLAGVPAVAVSAPTGEGMAQLRDTLDEVLAEVPRPDPRADVRLWVDRRFHVRGAGTVVTGTLPAGTVATGDRLDTGAGLLRVRGVESLGAARPSVSGTARVALDVVGDLAEGVVALTSPEAFEWSDVVDVRLRAAGEPGTRLPSRLHLHVGASTQLAHVRPLGEQHARLTLPERLPLRVGDRAVLRDPGSRALWGAEVRDCGPPRLARRGSAAARARALEAGSGSTADLLAARGVARRSHLQRLGGQGAPPAGSVQAGDWLVSPERVERAGEALGALVAGAGDGGLAVDAAARELGLPAEAVPLVVRPPLRVEGGRVRPPGAAPLPTRVRAALEQVRADLAASPFAAPDAHRLRELGLDAAGVTLLHRRRELLHVGDSVVLRPDAPDEAVRRLSGLAQPFTTSEARQVLQTSRRVVLPLLAHLDRTGRTLRLPDDRRRVRG